MKRMPEHLEFEACLKAVGLPQPAGNRGYRPEQLMTQFMLSIWCGANRFEHREVTRHDPVFKINGVTLDLDSTVMTRYGAQEGVVRGYNPGNTGSHQNVQAFLANTLHRMGEQRVALLRAHSGCCDSAFLDHLEERKMHDAIALRLQQPLQRALANTQGWWPLQDERGCTELRYAGL